MKVKTASKTVTKKVNLNEKISVDLLVYGGVLLTIDRERRVIDDGAIAINRDRIVAVGETADLLNTYQAVRMIDAHHKAVLPGLIDCHEHAGHGLVKTMGIDRPGKWEEACELIYSQGSTEEFWQTDAQLNALERLKFGVTCSVNIFGGGGNIKTGDMVLRTDDPIYGDLHCKAVEEIGGREFLAVGPRVPPFPHKYVQWKAGQGKEVQISLEDHLATCETLVQHWHGKGSGRIKICVNLPVYHPEATQDRSLMGELVRQAEVFSDFRKKHDLLLVQDGHSRGTVKFAHEAFGLLGKHALLSHSTNLTDEEIQIIAETDTRIIHNPSSLASILGRCPVPELLDAGVTVVLGSDGPAPDRNCDMFRHMSQCMHYHRTYFKDPAYMPPGKVLEMVTIDAAHALGLEEELGSLEPGKKADIILIDVQKPHLLPFNMPVYRIVYYANGSDVDTAIVDGRVIMENRVILTIDETEILNRVEPVVDQMLKINQLYGALAVSSRCWKSSKY
jgi:5-methylthioadenosine/S-adenosylhomocysteine deaminase